LFDGRWIESFAAQLRTAPDHARGEQTPQPFTEMRRHRRHALLKRIVVDHPAMLRRRTRVANPIICSRENPIQPFPDEPLLRRGAKKLEACIV